MAKAQEKTELEELEDMYRAQMNAEVEGDEEKDPPEDDPPEEDLEHEDDPEEDEGDDEDGDDEGDGVDDIAQIEAKARRAGWKPEDEYKGKEPWVDAEEFLERADKDSREMRRQNQNLQRTLEKLEKNVEALNKHHEREITVREEAAFERGRKSYEDLMQKAAKEGDTETYNKAMRGRDELMRTKQEREAKFEDDPIDNKKQDAPPPPPPSNWQKWAKENPWFETDAVLTDAAKRQCGIYAAQGKSAEEQLDLVHNYIRETYPHKFSGEDDLNDHRSKRRREPPRMPGGTRRPASKSIEPDSYEALKPKYKAECDRSLKANPKMKKEDFLMYCTPDMFTVTNKRED